MAGHIFDGSGDGTMRTGVSDDLSPRTSIVRRMRHGLAILACLATAMPALAADWPAFRGPRGDGTADAARVPFKWAPDENIRWKVPLPQPGNGSAIVVGDRVFVTSAEDPTGQRLSLICHRLLDGSLEWKQTVEIDREMPTHKTNPHAGTTPVADGQTVVVWHATGGLHAYALSGEKRWTRDFGEFRHIWGYGTSPILHGGRVILHSGPGKRVFVAALDLQSGETIWQTEEPVEGDGSNTPDRRYFGSWATPVVAKVGGQDQLIVAMPTRVVGYDPRDGKALWWCSGLRHGGGDLAYSSPLIVGNLCFMTGGFSGPAMAFTLGGTGDITDTARLWRTEKSPQSIGTGLVVGEHVYRPNAGPGTIECLDPWSGKVLWQDRGAGGNYWSSMVLAEGRAYATAQNGKTVVFEPQSAGYVELARNDVADATNATPAVVDGALVLRGQKSLICIGK